MNDSSSGESEMFNMFTARTRVYQNSVRNTAAEIMSAKITKYTQC